MKKSSAFSRFRGSKNFSIVIVLVIVCIVATAINRNYIIVDNIKLILYSCALSGTLAVGVGCILISGSVDLSCAAVGCMAGILITTVLNTGTPWVLALIIILIYGALCGLINAFFSYVLKLMPFIVTLAMLSVWQGIGYVLTNNATIMNTNKSFWDFCSGTLFGLIPYSFIYFCILAIIYGFILSNTKFGRKIYMVGGNRNAARLAGISISKMGTIMMVNCSVLGAFGGAILAGRMHGGNASSVHGTQLTAITAVVMGGVAFSGGSGNMLGAFLGILLLNAFNNALTVVGLSSFWQILSSGVLLIFALMLDFFNSQRNERILKQLDASTAQ